MTEIVIGMIVTSVCLMAIYNAAKIRKLEKAIDALIELVKPLQELEYDKQTIRKGELQLVNDTEDDPKQHYYYGKNEDGKIGYYWKDQEKGDKP